VAGERFAVRNSGATAVVEGVGDHGAEYMTGGTLVVLGETGRNFAAGMSGGVAYIFDEQQRFVSQCNSAMVDVEPLVTSAEQALQGDPAAWHLGQSDEALLRDLVEKQFRYTGSFRAKAILENWAVMRTRFLKVIPKEYRRALESMAANKKALSALKIADQPMAA
jgi:glutamate synthase (NADPH/NADH) large chain